MEGEREGREEEEGLGDKMDAGDVLAFLEEERVSCGRFRFKSLLLSKVFFPFSPVLQTVNDNFDDEREEEIEEEEEEESDFSTGKWLL
jgi:hypothetical protein